jgi:hypothetical protein
MFTRIGQEDQRAKKQTTIYAETISMRGKYIAIIYTILVLGGLFNEFSFDSLLQGFVCGLIYYLSNLILSAAAVTVHTKDAQFSAKYIKGKTVVVLNSSQQPQIKEERKTVKIEPTPEKEESIENLSTPQLRKKYSNMKFELKKKQETGDKKAISLQIDKIETFLDDLHEIEHEIFDELRKNWITIER